MSNVSSDFVFRLIQSLDKSEKRYFKLFINRLGDAKKSPYELLFDALSKQDEYDEAALLKKFKNHSFTDRFSVTKNRLYNHVLNALDAYHGNSSIRAKLTKSLHHVEILYRKRLLKQCAKILMAVEKTAREHEELNILLEVTSWKRRIDEKSNFQFLSDEDQSLIEGQHREALSKLQKEEEIMAIKREVFSLLYFKGKTRSENQLNQLAGIKEKIESEEAYTQVHDLAKYHFNHSAAAFHYLNNDHQKSLLFIERNIALIEASSDQDSFEEVMLLNLYSNAVFEYSRLKEKEQAEMYLEKLEQAQSKTGIAEQTIQVQHYVTLCMTKLAFFHLNDMLEEAMEEIPEMESSLKRDAKHIKEMDMAGLLFSMSTMYIRGEKFSDALKLLNRILNSLSINQNEDLFCFTQMLHLIAHIELDNKDFLIYAFKSTKRFLLTRKRIHRFEDSFLTLVKDLSKSKDLYTEKSAYENFVSALRDMRTDPFERRAFEYFDFLAWAEKKLDLLCAELRVSA